MICSQFPLNGQPNLTIDDFRVLTLGMNLHCWRIAQRPILNLLMTVVLTVLVLATPAYTQVEINGLIIDETRTTTGREFYRAFFESWGEPSVDITYNIVIREIPDARWGSALSIEINGTTAWRKILQPRSGKAREEAFASVPQVRRVLEYLRTATEENSGDLVGDGY